MTPIAEDVVLRVPDVAAADLSGAMVLDMEFFPAFEQQVRVAAGRVTLPAAAEPFAVCLPLAVEGFGHVFVYADNEGRGYEAREVAGRELDFAGVTHSPMPRTGPAAAGFRAYG